LLYVVLINHRVINPDVANSVASRIEVRTSEDCETVYVKKVRTESEKSRLGGEMGHEG